MDVLGAGLPLVLHIWDQTMVPGLTRLPQALFPPLPKFYVETKNPDTFIMFRQSFLVLSVWS